MIAYLLPGAGVANCAEDPRMHRLLRAGPWQYQWHPDGALATWKRDGNATINLASLGTPRETTDGLTYFPPKELPTPDSLLRPGLANRPDVHRVQVDTGDSVVTLSIIPAYFAPRRVLDNNTYGLPVAAYALKARMLRSRLSENPNLTVAEAEQDMWDVCREAIMHTTRCTRELIADCGWITEDSAWEIWSAVCHVPKAFGESGKGQSEPSSPPETSKG